MPFVFGYARVSTDGQTLDAQMAQLEAAGAGASAGAGRNKVFREKVSGAMRDSPQLTRRLASLSRGDVVLVTRLDRLARSTRDLLNVLAAVADTLWLRAAPVVLPSMRARCPGGIRDQDGLGGRPSEDRAARGRDRANSRSTAS